MVQRWDVITLGNLSRNRYWGESEERPLRAAICTCTLIRAEGMALLVDPSLSDVTAMAAELDRRTGLRIADVSHVFITHAHGDHHYGLRHFPGARWLAAPAVAEEINGAGKYEKRVEGVTGKIQAMVEVLPTPGHTPNHHSLRFECEGQCVIIAGDAVMTRDFWRERRGYFNTMDPVALSETMKRLAECADIIVPGHDNYFMHRR
jgi:glyoxylase-like metal-dependent hydrolase (beta-lactamase superfamily II)